MLRSCCSIWQTNLTAPVRAALPAAGPGFLLPRRRRFGDRQDCQGNPAYGVSWRVDGLSSLGTSATPSCWLLSGPDMATPSIIDTRRHQMFPTLEPLEIERLRRFGKVRTYAAGEAVFRVGEAGHGLIILLNGHVDISQQDAAGRPQADRHPRTRGVHGRAGAAWGAPGLGRRHCAKPRGGRRHPAGSAQGVADRRGRARRADHARPHPAPRRLDPGRCRRTCDRRCRGERRRAAACKLSEAQRPSAPAARSRDRPGGARR